MLKVFWTKRAVKKFEKICDYINSNWGIPTTNKFKKRVKLIVNLLSDFPEIRTIEFKNRNIRGIVVVRQLTLFYKVKDNKLIILNFFDNRQQPDKRKY